MRRDPDRTRERILAEAFNDLHRQGFHETSLDAIADRAGVTKGALYHHFESKEALGLAVLDEMVGGYIRQHWIEPLGETDNPLALIAQLFGGKITAIPAEAIKLGCPLSNLSQEMSACSDGFRKVSAKIYGEWRSAIAGALGRGQESGSVRKGIDADAVANFLIAYYQGLAGLLKNSRNRDMALATTKVLEDFLDGLRAGERSVA